MQIYVSGDFWRIEIEEAWSACEEIGLQCDETNGFQLSQCSAWKLKSGERSINYISSIVVIIIS